MVLNGWFREWLYFYRSIDLFVCVLVINIYCLVVEMEVVFIKIKFIIKIEVIGIKKKINKKYGKFGTFKLVVLSLLIVIIVIVIIVGFS